MRRREGGFTFVEIMLALTVGAIVVAGLYRSFTTLHKWWIASSVTSDQRQNARLGLETVTRDLEMAGYHTTTYGDPNKGGIAITLAAAGEIEMDQQRPDDDTIEDPDPTFAPRLVYYHLATDMTSGRQNLYRQTRTEPGLAAPDEIVAENVGAFSLEYFDEHDAPVAGLPPESPGGSAAYVPGVAVLAGSPLRAIRRVRVTLTTLPARAALFGAALRDFTLTASVTPQNLASLGEVTPDVTPPAVPTGLGVIDTRTCGAKLHVKWNPNPESDLAGYVVFYGPTGGLLVPLRALADPSDPRIDLGLAGVLVTKNADRATAPNVHTIQVAAYDSAGNHSARSAAVAANPSPDVTDFADGDDTTVNPLKPPAPTGLTVVPGAHDGELVVSWAEPAGGVATAGYRLYRSPAPFADGHVNDALLVAGEGDLPPGVTTWTDSGLTGCQAYHYALASVNCDETLVATYLHATSGASDYAVASGTPADTVPPPAPSLAGSLPDVERILITLESPLEVAAPDFDRSEIFWSKSPAAAPQLDGVSGAVSGGQHIPDSDGGSAGVFTRRGSQVVIFDSEGSAAPLLPSLEAGATYHLLAVAYDRCGNASAPDARSLVVLAPPECVDDPPGPPPPAFGSPGAASCQPDAVELSWEYPGPDVVADLFGFRVARDPGGELTDGPTRDARWTDAGPLLAGGEYTYTITATDCAWEIAHRDNLPSPHVDPLPALTIGPIRPGGLRRHEPAGGDELAPENFVVTLSDDPSAYTYHNNVRLFLENTSRSVQTIKRMAVTWDAPDVVLSRVVIGGSPSSTTERTIDVGGVPSGSAFGVDVLVDDVAAGVGSPSGPLPVQLRFTTPNGSVNRLVDLRGQALGLSLWVGNASLGDVDCPAPTRIEIAVPRGPLLGGFSQSAPGRYGIDSYEVVGQSGSARDTDVRVPHGVAVNVFGTAFDRSRELFADGVNRGFTVLKVVGIAAAPADPAAAPAMPTSGAFFDRPLQGLGGDRYAIFEASAPAGALMPQDPGAVLWYTALAVDATGNWDRAPNPDRGAYAYFQPPFDACSATPRAPELTLSSSNAAGAVLDWTAPTEYESGIAISADDSLTYDVYVKTAGGDPWPADPAGANLAGLTFTHAADLNAGTYYYMVVARNSCATEPRQSAESNVVMECEGASGVDCSLFRVPESAPYGDPILLSAAGFCSLRDNHTADSVVFRVTGGTTTDFTAPEVGDEGAFAKTITAVWTGGGGDSVAAPAGTLGVELQVGGTAVCPARAVTLTGGACFTTPNPATGLSAAGGGTGSAAVVLSWFRPNFNTDGTALADLAGYEIELARCADTNAGTCRAAYWAPFGARVVLNDPAAQTYTWSGLVVGERFKFRLRAKDSCATPNSSGWIESGQVTVP